MIRDQVDILMIHYNRQPYTELSLPRLLETCDSNCRVWLWQNGSDEATLNTVRQYLDHPRIHRFHHNPDNSSSTPTHPLNEPIRWLWEQSDGEFLTKVDDDCMMPHGWVETLRQAHRAEPGFGVLGCWRFPEEDFHPRYAQRKIRSFGGHRIMQSLYIEGSGFMMKRQCIDDFGLLPADISFPEYCIGLAERGWIHGWYFPFLYQEHMDDPRSPHTLLKTDADIECYMPLTARVRGDRTLEAWQRGLQRNALRCQAHPPDPRWHKGWRHKLHMFANRVRSKLGVTSAW